MQDRIFYSISFGFICGILLASIFTWNAYLTYFVFLVSLILILVSKYILRNKWGIIASFFFLTFSVGIIYFNYFDAKFKYDLEDKVGVEFIFVGKIVDDIENRNLDKRFKLKTSLSDAYILVKTESKVEIAYGDIVSVSGKLVKPTNFKTDIGKDFDYINYLKKDNILYTLEAKKLEILDRNKGNKFKTFLFKIKNSFLGKINDMILPYESTLLGGLILGERSSFSDVLREDFIKTGTIHIVALSGYNVTIVAEWFMKLLYFLPFIFSIYGGIIMIILFVLMTGAYATSVRAGIMAILVLIAKVTGRPYDVLRAVILTIILMLFYNPYLLYFDISFELSYRHLQLFSNSECRLIS
jgi:competence protein ComEC